MQARLDLNTFLLRNRPLLVSPSPWDLRLLPSSESPRNRSLGDLGETNVTAQALFPLYLSTKVFEWIYRGLPAKR
jgi:hypothetical protein